MAAARITGQVLRTERRSGTSKASGNPYDFTEVGVLVASRDVTSFTVQASAGVSFSAGDLIDIVVDLSVYAGRLDVSYVGSWLPAFEAAVV
ncbi:MAG TPA: hypothetical protein VGC67_01885 [Cellulomonas sp.]